MRLKVCEQRHLVEALIVALPETAGSALYGMVDVLSATGTLWQELVGEEPGAQLIRPRIVSLSRAPFQCGNGIPVMPELDIAEEAEADVIILPGAASRRLHLLFGLLGLCTAGGDRIAQRPRGDIPLGLQGSVSQPFS
jgi:hypothetical protein